MAADEEDEDEIKNGKITSFRGFRSCDEPNKIALLFLNEEGKSIPPEFFSRLPLFCNIVEFCFFGFESHEKFASLIADWTGLFPYLKKIYYFILIHSGQVLNDWDTLWTAMVFLKKLRVLNLLYCSLGDEGVIGLSRTLDAYPELEELWLRKVGMGEFGAQALGEVLPFLTTLKMLCISDNPFGESGLCLLREGLSRTHQLQGLWLDWTGIKLADTALPPLNSLHVLILAENALTRVPESILQCPMLEVLDISYNKLITLPRWLLTMPNLRDLCTRGNTLIFPPRSALGFENNILKNFREYCEALDKSGGNVFHCYNLVFLGEAMAGKTSLIRSLHSQQQTLTSFRERTRLVEFTSLHFTKYFNYKDPYVFRAVDLGGQDTYRLAQRLFVSNLHSELSKSRTVYVLVVAIDSDPSKEKIMAWVKFLPSCPSGERLPILVVASKIDLCPSTYLREERVRKLERYLTELNFDAKIIKSCDGPEGKFHDVFVALARNLAESLPSFEEVIPTAWIMLAQFLESMPVDTNISIRRLVISVKEMFALIQSSSSPNKPSFSTIAELRAGLSFAHSLGLIFFFETSTILRDIIFLSPQLVADALKAIVRHDPEKLLSIEVSSTPYTAGSVQLSLDIQDLLRSGRLYHRLLPALLSTRIRELRDELNELSAELPKEKRWSLTTWPLSIGGAAVGLVLALVLGSASYHLF